MRHTITAHYHSADGTKVPVDIAYNYYPTTRAIVFLWCQPGVDNLNARTRTAIEPWAYKWLLDHVTEAVKLAEEA